ncbi:hypothetical protein [Nostoc sp. PCC 7524]|uniref:hypothetical protein n=1 Tax=Nostoc sp. (strain ATCC 29411 / PCC 7524) TaxID=28072 RepID=UPI001493ED78|nr:hypothetical protein [Nostoc sp. PCC 7524]
MVTRICRRRSRELPTLTFSYANNLIIKRKQAAVRVSPQIWDAIEARMLLVEDI